MTTPNERAVEVSPSTDELEALLPAQRKQLFWGLAENLRGSILCAGEDLGQLLSAFPTNLASGHWTLEATNAFDANGAFSITNTLAPGTPQELYRLRFQQI